MHTPNYLQLFRKRAHLTREDVAFILQVHSLPDISRWESGTRQPRMHVRIIYHLLFNIPMQTLFTPDRQELTQGVCERIDKRIQELELLLPDPKVQCRIAFLEDTLKRLTQ